MEEWIQTCRGCVRRKTPASEDLYSNGHHTMELDCKDFLSLETSKGRIENILVITDHFTMYGPWQYQNVNQIARRCTLRAATQDSHRPRTQIRESAANRNMRHYWNQGIAHHTLPSHGSASVSIGLSLVCLYDCTSSGILAWRGYFPCLTQSVKILSVGLLHCPVFVCCRSV